jgi:hypothetical protein
MSETFGTQELCMWPVGPGTSRFQTRRPDLARKLSQRSGTRLVAWSVAGGYLRIYQDQISPRSARKLVTRYLKTEESATRPITPTNARFSSPKGSVARRKRPVGLRQDQGSKTVSNGLVTIDLDQDSYVEALLVANPLLGNTLRTRAVRGCNIWLRCSGEYPSLQKLKNSCGEEIGEWRADGSQTIIAGTHQMACRINS